MSRPLMSWMLNSFRNDAAIKALVGTDDTGLPSIFPAHDRDVSERATYPHVTVARFGNVTGRGVFQNVEEWAAQMDPVRFALCVFDTQGIDNLYKIYVLCDAYLRGQSANPGNEYFVAYKIVQTHFRDDLFDPTVNAYHLHAEYSCWVRYPAGVTQP